MKINSQSDIKNILKNNSNDGKISKKEFKSLEKKITNSNLPKNEKSDLVMVLNELKEKTNIIPFKSDGVLEQTEVNEIDELVSNLDGDLAKEFYNNFKETNKSEIKKDQNFLVSLFEKISIIFSKFVDKIENLDNNKIDSSNISINNNSSYNFETGNLDFPDDMIKNDSYTPVLNSNYESILPSYDLNIDDDNSLENYFLNETNSDISKKSSSDVKYKKSKYHSENKFIPSFGMTAYHESGMYRSKSDPYAVGAISKPTRKQDLGGKTYGTYQFESRVYKDGSKGKGVNGTTLMRFIKSPSNPFSSDLKDIVDKYGIASSKFDEKWTELSLNQNKTFGLAQQNFLKQDKLQAVEKFFDRANIGQEARNDERIFDLVMGTTNQIGGLAGGLADHISSLQKQNGKPFNADKLGLEIIKHKKSKVGSWFRSSPKAQNGVKNRYIAEATVFNKNSYA